MLPIWVIVTLVMLGVVIFLIKTINQVYFLALIKENFFYFFIIFIFIFFSISVTHIYQNNNIDLGSFDGWVVGGKLYFSWLRTVFLNLAEVTGYAVKQDWLINSTNSSVK